MLHNAFYQSRKKQRVADGYSILNFSLQGEYSVENRKRLIRLKDTAYFGRIDFLQDDAKAKMNIYVGVHNFQDPESGTFFCNLTSDFFRQK